MAKSKSNLTEWPAELTVPTAEMIAYARERGVDAAAEFENFRDHALAKDCRYKDWTAAWRTWVRRCYAAGTPQHQTYIGFKFIHEREPLPEISPEERQRNLKRLDEIIRSVGRAKPL